MSSELFQTPAAFAAVPPRCVEGGQPFGVPAAPDLIAEAQRHLGKLEPAAAHSDRFSYKPPVSRHAPLSGTG